MPFTAKDFESLIGTSGFSETLLRNHFKLYEGYVKNTNDLLEKFRAATKDGKSGTYEIGELRRRFGWEFNGMRLHEYYFGNMHKAPAAIGKDGPAAKNIAAQFGSYDAWLADFIAAGKARGIGWVALAWDPVSKESYNVWFNEHDVGLPAAAHLLLVLDVFEHAYVTDYGINKAAYLDGFIKAIDWHAVDERTAGKRDV